MIEERWINPIVAAGNIILRLDPHDARLSEDDVMELGTHINCANVILDAKDKRIADLERQLAEARQENAALRAEVERRKLKWQTGPVPARGWYWKIDFIGDYPECVFYFEAIDPTDREMRGSRVDSWAGPIPPPEE